ncbi:MAG TPA: protease pro-enzyme activation domain-containing protein, partial [Ktedonobacterales bacterium]
MTGRATPHRPRGTVAGALALTLLASALVACGPAAPSSGGAATQARPASSPRLAGNQAPGGGKAAVLIGPTDPARLIAVTLILPGRAPSELAQTLAALRDPHSPSYHHYLSASEYAQRFGVAPQAQARVESFLRANDLPITKRAQNGQFITVRGSVAKIEALFGVTLRDYRTADNQQYYAPTGAPQIPAALRGAVTSVLGLDRSPAFHSAGLRKLTRTAAAPEPKSYTPADLERLYDIGPLH